MKKILFTVCIFITLLAFSIPSFAAWQIIANIEKATRTKNDEIIYRVKVYGKSDASDPAEFNLSTYLSSGDMKAIEGSQWVQCDTDPGTEPDAVWAVNFDNDLGADLLDLSGLSVTATELHDTDTDIGFRPYIWDLQIDIGDIGSAGDEVTIYLYFIK